ncbi:MAG: rhomboid family intramembrane serine protease [Anaerolineales bacterium]|nr:rhomboid family intramembrane serine protease [Anaerolineales bacterium]
MNEYPASDVPQTVPPQQPVRVALPQAAPYVTYTIIGITVIIYLLQLATQALLQVDVPVAFFIKANDLIREGQLWRLLTPALVHGSFAHIGFNMYALFSFGTSLERYFGRGRFLTLYLLGAFAGNVASFLFSDAYSLGASTAIFGLIGAEAVFLYRNRKLLAGQFRSAIGNVLFIIAINLFLVGSLPGIDNWGHIGGLLGGLMFTWFASPLWEIEGIQPMLQLVDKRPSREVVTGVVLVLAVFGALAVWGMVR